jgi:hypothetical protein
MEERYTCDNCDALLEIQQIYSAIWDAGVDDDDGITFCCSTYTDEHGCQGNDIDKKAYWYTR